MAALGTSGPGQHHIFFQFGLTEYRQPAVEISSALKLLDDLTPALGMSLGDDDAHSTSGMILPVDVIHLPGGNYRRGANAFLGQLIPQQFSFD